MPARRTSARASAPKPTTTTTTTRARASSSSPQTKRARATKTSTTASRAKHHAPTVAKAKALASRAPLTLATAEMLWDDACGDDNGASAPENMAATLKYIASGGGKGRAAIDVGDEAARWLTVKINAAFGSDGVYGSDASSPSKSTKRNLSVRFDPGHEDEDEDDATSLERPGKRRKLTAFEKTWRVASSALNLGRDGQSTVVIEGKRFDKETCDMVEEGMNVSGRIDVTRAKRVLASVQARSSQFGLSAKSMDTLLMFADGGVGDFKVAIDTQAKTYLRRAVEDEKTLGPERGLSPRNPRATLLRRLADYVRPKHYRIIDGTRYDNAVCDIADRSMERIGRIDLACARTIHQSIEDGPGITPTEIDTIKLLLAGGRADVLFIVDDDARAYFLQVLGVSSSAAAAELSTPPHAVEVHRNAPASVLHSALKKAPTTMTSALKRPIAAPSTKKKGVVFTPARRFEMRTYVPSPESNSSLRSDETDSDEDAAAAAADDDDEGDDGSEKTSKLPDVAIEVRPSALGAFLQRLKFALAKSGEFWLAPVSVYDTVAACLVTLTVLLIAHFCIVASYHATLLQT